MDLSSLGSTGTCDFTTIGRRSGRSLDLEIWYVVVDGCFMITGTPGPRRWIANVRADPRLTLHLRNPTRTVDAVADEVVDTERRKRFVPLIWTAQPWYAEQPFTVDEWVEAAPMIVVRETNA